MAKSFVPLFLIASFILYCHFNVVECDGGSPISQEVEDCKDVCRKNFKIRTELKSCIEKCHPSSVPSNGGNTVETCVKGCIHQHPEGQALCELKCKNQVPTTKQLPFEMTSKLADADGPEVPEDAFDIFGRINSRASKMVECLLDGMRHQMKYGWAGAPDMIDSRIGKFMGDSEDFFKDNRLPETIPIEGDMKAPVLSNVKHISLVGSLVGGKEDHKGAFSEDIPSYQPILHRLIIIRKIAPFSLEESDEAEQASEIAMVDNMAERLKNLFVSFFDDPVPVETSGARSPDSAKVSEITNLKSVKVEGEAFVVKKESNGKFCDFLASLAHKSGLRRTTFILIMAIILLCFAWYCIATILSNKHQKEMSQEHAGKPGHEDLEYLVPIEEKFIFFAHLGEKEKVGDVVQAPSIPIKIKIQDV